MAKYNATKLDGELRTAGLKIHGCSSTGRIDWVKSPSKGELDKAKKVLGAHHPGPNPKIRIVWQESQMLAPRIEERELARELKDSEFKKLVAELKEKGAISIERL